MRPDATGSNPNAAYEPFPNLQVQSVIAPTAGLSLCSARHILQ